MTSVPRSGPDLKLTCEPTGKNSQLSPEVPNTLLHDCGLLGQAVPLHHPLNPSTARWRGTVRSVPPLRMRK